MTIWRIQESRMRQRIQAGLPPVDDKPSLRAVDKEPETETERRERTEALRKQGADQADEYDEKYEAINAKCDQAVRARHFIIHGIATEEQIREVTKDSPDPFIQIYAQGDIDLLKLVCLNHGIDPTTGKVDETAANLIIDAAELGHSEQEALYHARLGAHSHIPDQMLRDDEFVDRLAAARERAQRRDGAPPSVYTSGCTAYGDRPEASR